MSNNIIWKVPSPAQERRGIFFRLHAIHLHGLIFHSSVVSLSFLVVILAYMLTIETKLTADSLVFEIAYKKTYAVQATWFLRDIRGVDVMKFTKDTVRNQPSDLEIQNIVNVLANNLYITHIATAVPLDSSEDYNAQNKPQPRNATDFTQAWSDTIHNKGLNIIWRGTWSGIEGIYDFPKRVGTNRFPAGTAASAAIDGNATWLGKTYLYIVSHPEFFKDGDMWAVLPERTEGIFQDSTSFLPYDAPGIQTNYAQFFIDLKKVSDTAFAKIGKKVITGMTANNFTELNSQWMRTSLIDEVNILSVDHYGLTHTVQEMENDLRSIYNKYHHQVFWQEWGDYWNVNVSAAEREQYVKDMYSVFQKLTNENILAGFNYWGGWDNNSEGILTKTNGVYALNNRGKILAEFFKSNSPLAGVITVEVTAPAQSSSTPVSLATTTPTTTAATTPPPTSSSSGSSTQTPSSPAPSSQVPSNPSPAPSSASGPAVALGSSSGQSGSGPNTNLNNHKVEEEKGGLETQPVNTPSPDNNPAPSLLPMARNDYPTGALLLDGTTVYLIDNYKKIPFTNFSAFVGLGYSTKNIIKGSSDAYALADGYSLSSKDQQHPWHSWVINKNTIYYVHGSGLIGVPSYEIFLQNGGQLKFVVKANKVDLQILNSKPKLPHLQTNDYRINN